MMRRLGSDLERISSLATKVAPALGAVATAAEVLAALKGQGSSDSSESSQGQGRQKAGGERGGRPQSKQRSRSQGGQRQGNQNQDKGGLRRVS
jgi:hypothetical protein